MHDMNTTVYMQ